MKGPDDVHSAHYGRSGPVGGGDHFDRVDRDGCGARGVRSDHGDLGDPSHPRMFGCFDALGRRSPGSGQEIDSLDGEGGLRDSLPHLVLGDEDRHPCKRYKCCGPPRDGVRPRDSLMRE